MAILTWHGCYDDSWKGLITDESFAHPAKMAHGLLSRIIKHGFEQGWWKAGDVIGEPFGGIGSTGLLCSYNGLRSVSVELEERFVALALLNFQAHRRAWEALGEPLPVILQGDSRQFASLIGRVDACVTSPPYAETGSGGNMHSGAVDTAAWSDGRVRKMGPSMMHAEGYGSTPGQIGRLAAGKIDAVLTSPPYAESLQSGQHGIDFSKASPKWGGRETPGRAAASERHASERRYGTDPQNIGNLKEGRVDGIVTSPPWEQNSEGVNRANKFKDPEAFARLQMDKGHGASLRATMRKMQAENERAAYGDSDGQIGNSNGETYWQAMRQVYQQVHQALKPGGVAAIVCKDYVKQGKRVPLCDDTLKLLTALGFEPVERIRAMLVKQSTESTLFEGTITKTKSRKSFFRRLCEAKGAPKIDYEEVIVVRKP